MKVYVLTDWAVSDELPRIKIFTTLQKANEYVKLLMKEVCASKEDYNYFLDEFYSDNATEYADLDIKITECEIDNMKLL